MSHEQKTNKGWLVTFAGMGINLALGVLYTWSIIAGGLDGWTQTEKSIPYSIACGIFALTMVPAGRLQDRFGPRLTASIGGVLTGLGFVFCYMVPTFTGYVVGFGILAGAGIGFGYASATPPAIKWFPAARTGLIAGLVVSGFGLAAAYMGPLANWMIAQWTLQTTMLVLGIAFMIVVVGLAQLLTPPPAGYVAEAPRSKGQEKTATAAAVRVIDVAPTKMIATGKFWVLWIMYACGAGAGLMIIGKLKPIVREASDLTWFAPLCLAFLSVGNAAGRIVAGMMSDRIGRTMTMFLIFIVQAGVMISLIFFGSVEVVVFVLAILAGFNYGANLSVFPSATKDLFGLKNFGINYGIMFTAWGFGGVVLPLIAGKVVDATQNFNLAYVIAAACLVLASILTFVVRTAKTTPPESDHDSSTPTPASTVTKSSEPASSAVS